ncbi:MAG: PfkB family carbohydrate kinase [bacterium]
MSILVVGSVAYDTIETPREKRERILGGSASFFSLAATRFAPVRAVGVVGDDFRQSDLDLLAAAGIDISGIQRVAGATFFWAGRYHDDLIERDTLTTELGVFADFRPEIPETWRDSPYLFLANIQPDLQGHVLDAMSAPKLVVLDTMNLWIETTRDALLQVLGRVHVLMVNDSEARMLSGEYSLARAAAVLQQLGPTWVVIKKGEHGALLFGRDSVLAVPGILLPEVVDPTGAGDTFAGGFVGSLAAAGADSSSADPVFRQAMLDGTVTASFCPECFSVDGLRLLDESEYQNRLANLRAMMIP